MNGNETMTYLTTILPVAGLVSAFMRSNLVSQAIVAILGVVSVIAWSLIISKWTALQEASNATQDFLAAYRKEAHPVAIFLKRQRYAPSPVYAVYEQSCRALGAQLEGRSSDAEDLFMGAVGTTDPKLSEVQSNAVRNATDRTRATQTTMLEQNMGFVALATTTAPLLGLLGTLWSAMDAFQALRSGEATDLVSLLAPVVSCSLLPMVVGLLVAIPSGIGYNILTDRIRRLCVQMGEFSQELLTSVETHYLRQK